jgi:hypothetical protein
MPPKVEEPPAESGAVEEEDGIPQVEKAGWFECVSTYLHLVSIHNQKFISGGEMHTEVRRDGCEGVEGDSAAKCGGMVCTTGATEDCGQ